MVMRKKDDRVTDKTVVTYSRFVKPKSGPLEQEWIFWEGTVHSGGCWEIPIFWLQQERLLLLPLFSGISPGLNL